MPRYDYPSRYFADDKDIADILAAPKFSKKKLLSLALSRGLILSHELSSDALVEQLSRNCFSWRQLQELLQIIETPDSEEKVTTCRCDSKASSDEMHKTLRDVQEIRGLSANEAYIINKTEKGFFVRIKYSEVDQSSTRVLQRVHKEMEVHIESTDEGWEFRYPANPRAELIVAKITDNLPLPEGTPKPKKQTIELAGVVDPAVRTEFFVLLMDGMEGFKRRDVLDLKMNRIPVEENGTGDHESEGDATDDGQEIAAEDLKGLVRRMALTGQALLLSPQFQQLKHDGFYISRTVWEAAEVTGDGRIFELEAQFKNAEGGMGFCYQVRGVHNLGDDGEVEVTRKAIGLADRKTIHKTLEAAAYAAIELIRAKVSTPNDSGPLSPEGGE